MQEICSKTGGGVGPDPLETITPEEMEARVAAQLLDGEGSMLVRPTQQPFAITTAKKQRKVGCTILLCKIIHFANT